MIAKLIKPAQEPYAPPAEMAVFLILKDLREATAPGVTRASEGKVSSVAAAYTLLGRLEKRGLVSRREEHVQVGDMPIRRVLYRAIDGVSLTKAKENPNAKTSSAKRAEQPAREIAHSDAKEVSIN